MKELTIYFELYQPYAQYRNPFTFYYAQTFPLPPKSTVVGMLQNATQRYYDMNFWNLKVSIHGGFESVFWNYQQLIKGYPEIEIDKERPLLVVEQETKKGKKPKLPLYNEGIKAQRTPVHQQELFNGHLHIFIRGDKSLLDEIYFSLEKPKKVLSLGRSEDIAFIRNLLLLDGSKITHREAEKSLWLTFPTYIRKEIKLNDGTRKEFPIRAQKYPIYSIPTFVAFYNDNIPIKNKVEINKEKTERKVEFEEVIYTSFDYVVKLSEPIQYEEIYIDNKRFRIVEEFGWL